MSKKKPILVEANQVTLDFEPTQGQNTLLINIPGTVNATVSTTSEYTLSNVQLKREDVKVFYKKTTDVTSTFYVSFPEGKTVLSFGTVKSGSPSTQSFYLTPIGPPTGHATDYTATAAITLGIDMGKLTYDVAGEEGGVSTSPNPWTVSTH